MPSYIHHPVPKPGPVELSVVTGRGRINPPIVKLTVGEDEAHATLTFHNHSWACATVKLPGGVVKGGQTILPVPPQAGGRPGVASIDVYVNRSLRNIEIPYEVYFYDPENHHVRGMGKATSPPSMVIEP